MRISTPCFLYNHEFWNIQFPWKKPNHQNLCANEISSSWYQIIILFCAVYQIESLFSLAYSHVWEKQLNSNDEKTDQVALCSTNIVTFCTYSLLWYSAVVSTIFDQSYFLPLKWPFQLTKHARLTKVLGCVSCPIVLVCVLVHFHFNLAGSFLASFQISNLGGVK